MEAELKAGGEIETLLSEVGVPPLVVRAAPGWEGGVLGAHSWGGAQSVERGHAAAVCHRVDAPPLPARLPRLQSGTEGTDTFVKAAESTALVQLSIMAGDASVFVIDAVLEPPLGEEEAVEAAPGAPEGTTVPSAAAANVASAAAVAAGLLAAALLA